MTVANGQPEVRFSKVGPHSFEGVSFEPKVMYFEKDITGAENDDFWTIPAETYVEQVFCRVETALDGSGTVTIGEDGNPDGFIDTTGFDCSSAGNMGTNLGTTVANASGYYYHASDTMRIAVGGTPTEGKISGFIRYYELAQMASRGIHFDL